MAAGSLGSLEINVLANIANMVSDLDKGQKEIAKFAHESKESLEGIGESLLKVAELFGVGFSLDALKEVAARAIETAEQLDHLSQATGISVSTLQQMQSTATLTGTSLEVASGAIEKLERSAVQATTGNKNLASTFNAIGISSKELGELLKDPDALIQEVTKHLAEFSNGAGKTTAVMQLMGRGAAQNIPLINELGEKFVELSLKAQQFGIQLSELDQGQLKAAAEGLNEVKNAGAGLGNQFAVVIAPAIIAVSHALVELATSAAVQQFFLNLRDDVAEFVIVAGHVKDAIAEWVGESSAGTAHMRQDFAQFVADSMSEVDTFVTKFEIGVVGIQAGFDVLWAEVQTGFNAAIAFIERGAAKLAAGLGEILSATGDAAGAMQLKGLAQGLDQLGSSYKTVTADVSGYQFKVQSLNLDLALAKKANNDLAQGIRDETIAMLAANKAHEAGDKPILQLSGDLEKAAKAAQKLAQDGLEASKFLDGLAGKLDGEYSKAWSSYEGAIDQADKMAIKFTADGMALAKVQQFIAEATELAREKLFEQTDANYNLDKALNAANESLAKRQALVGLTGTALATEIEYEKLLDAAMKDLKGVMGPLTEAEQARIESLHGIAAATVAADEASKAYSQSLKEWEGIATNGFDSVGKSIAGFATGSIKSWKDFGASLVDDTKQFIAAIIEEFLKLEVFNGVINSLFGSNLPTGLASLASIGGGGGAAGSAGSLLSSGSSGAGLLAKLFGGGGSSAFAGSSAAGSVSGGAPAFAGSTASAAYGGFGSIGGVGSTFGQGYTSGLGALGGALAGLYAGYNEFKAAGGGLGGAAGGAAYGIGTFALGGAISAGVSAAAAGGISAGLTAGFAAIPVVGWIALGAMAINIISGGKLFGTAAKPYGAEENLKVGPGGASISAAIDEKGQKAFFGGTYYKQVSTPVDKATQDSVEAFYDSLSKAATAEATAFGQTTATIVTGSFKETFDKAGKMLTQTSTVLGQTFTESIQDFQTRMVADTLLANMGAASAEAQKIAQQWQATATDLLAGAQFLAQAESDITQGHALAAGDTLTQLVDVVTSLQAPGESLIQAYARLSAEETDLSNSLALLGLSTGKTGEDFLKFADTLATAAGGLQNLDSLWSNYYTEFFSDQERQANTLKALQNNVTGSFAAIGEDSSVSMAQFRKDFEAAMPTLTPQQVVQWLVAGDALAKLNAALAQTGQAATVATAANTKAYQDFVAQFNPQTLGLSAFESSLIGIGGTMQQNIDQANALAKAAGMSGASLEDIGNIIQASANQGVAALRTLEDQAAQLAQSLYGTSLDQLNKQLADAQAKYVSDQGNSTLDYMFGASDQQSINAIQSQIDAANKQAEAAKRLSDSSTLLTEFAQIGSVTGESLDQLGARFSVPLDKFAADLGLTNDQLKSQFGNAEAVAQAAIKSNDLLQDILNTLQGKAVFSGTSVATQRGVGGQQNTLSSDSAPLTSAQAAAIVSHLQELVLHSRDTSNNTGTLVRKANEPLPFNRNGRGVSA